MTGGCPGTGGHAVTSRAGWDSEETPAPAYPETAVSIMVPSPAGASPYVTVHPGAASGREAPT